jgi:hypothetical protein
VAARGASASCGGFGFARNTATTFDVLYWLQVTNFDVLLNSAPPNGLDYIDVWGLCLHVSFCFISRVSIMVCVIYRIGECALGALFEKLTVSCP